MGGLSGSERDYPSCLLDPAAPRRRRGSDLGSVPARDEGERHRVHRAIAAAHAAGRKISKFLTSCDIILSTMLAGPPPKLGCFDQNGDVQTFTERVTGYLSVTPLHNATGTPPLHWTADGLPLGAHFAGRYGEEATLLALAAQLATAQPRFDRVPAL